MRTEAEIAEMLLRARLRRERRLRAYMPWVNAPQDHPQGAALRDLLQEASRLTYRLEDRLTDMRGRYVRV